MVDTRTGESHLLGLFAQVAQHGPVLYLGTYGGTFLNYTSLYANLARGTRFAIPTDKQQILESYLLDGQVWLIRGGRWDLGVQGLDITRGNDGVGSANVLLEAAQNLSSLPSPRQGELAAFIAHHAVATGKKRR